MPCLISIGFGISQTFLISIDITMHFIDTCFNWYHIDFDFIPWNNSLILCFELLGGEEFVSIMFVFTPLLMIDKKGEKNLEIICMIYAWVLV